MVKDEILKAKQQHRAKFTEGLLETDVVLDALNICHGQTVVDAGCGNGYMSMLFSKKVGLSGMVYALDRDRFFLNALEREMEAVNIEVMEGDITRPTLLRESSLDLVYISTVIHIFSRTQMQDFIREVRRVLKPDALLAIVEIEKRETPFGPPLASRYSPEELMGVVPMVSGKTVKVGQYFYMQLFRNRAAGGDVESG